MWMLREPGVFSSWSIAFTGGQGSHAGVAGWLSGGLWWGEGGRTTAPSASGRRRFYGFTDLAIMSLRDCRRLPGKIPFKPMKRKDVSIGTRIATERVPVMYRPLDEDPAAQQRAETRHEQAPTERPSKGKTGRELCKRHGGSTGSPRFNWEASGQFGRSKRHSVRDGVLCVRRSIPAMGASRILDSKTRSREKATCQPRRYAVVSDLPHKRLMRATRIRAVQARRVGIHRQPVYQLRAGSGARSPRKASSEESAYRTVLIPTFGSSASRVVGIWGQGSLEFG